MYRLYRVHWVLLLLLVSFLWTVKGQAPGAVRLNDGDTSIANTEGVVEIFYDKKWRSICDEDGDGDYGNIPDVVCHQLGYTGGEASQYFVSSDIGFYDMSCKKDYLVILQCTYKTGDIPASCNSNSDSANIIRVKCYITRLWDRAPYSGMVRLVDGYYTGQGIVEVYCHGKWGVVCYSDGVLSFAHTVCNQLGYNFYENINDIEFSNTFASMKATDCGGDSKKCVTDCSSCNDNIDSCDNGILNVTCQYVVGNSKHGNKIGACTPISLYPGQFALTALVLVLILYLYFITRVCIKFTTFCRRKRRGQPLLQNHNDENDKCRIICDVFCCN